MNDAVRDPIQVDVYFSPRYGRLCETLEGGILVPFAYEDEHGAVLYQFLQRPIEGGPPGCTDLITPYGYGGPLVLAADPACRDDLIQAFFARFSEYCRDHRVVSEFVRFHPIEKNHEGFEGCYQINSPRRTLATNLQDYGPPLTGEFSASRRRNIRKCLEAGVTVDLDFTGASLDAFLGIYTDTMTRNEAKSFYFFDRSYFTSLVDTLAGHVLIANARLAGRTIASGIYLHNGTYIHAHLSGTLTEFLHLSPASLLRSTIADWGHHHGRRFFHHGGGTSNRPDDGLYLFKKSFCVNTEFDFNVGRKIWDPTVYDALVRKAGSVPDDGEGFFPAYRTRS